MRRLRQCMEGGSGVPLIDRDGAPPALRRALRHTLSHIRPSRSSKHETPSRSRPLLFERTVHACGCVRAPQTLRPSAGPPGNGDSQSPRAGREGVGGGMGRRHMLGRSQVSKSAARSPRHVACFCRCFHRTSPREWAMQHAGF